MKSNQYEGIEYMLPDFSDSIHTSHFTHIFWALHLRVRLTLAVAHLDSPFSTYLEDLNRIYPPGLIVHFRPQGSPGRGRMGVISSTWWCVDGVPSVEIKGMPAPTPISYIEALPVDLSLLVSSDDKEEIRSILEARRAAHKKNVKTANQEEGLA